MKARVKVYVVSGYVLIKAQVKQGFFWNTLQDFQVRYARDEAYCIEQAKQRIQRFVDAGFDGKGVIEVKV